MKKSLFILLLIALGCTHCSDDDTPCSTLATVKDLSELDVCGFVLELEDGSFLQPQLLLMCGTPPVDYTAGVLLVDESRFELVDGKRVRISYEETGDLSICMAGPVVKITCIHEVKTHNPEED